MLPIYICEDNEKVRQAQRQEIEKQILIHGYDMQVVACTGHPEAIITAMDTVTA